MLDRLWLTLLAGVDLWALWNGHRLPALAATLALLVAVSLWLWRRWCLGGVTYRRIVSERRVVQGAEVALNVEICNLKLLPLTWLRIEDGFPVHAVLSGGIVVEPHAGDTFRQLVTTLAMLPYEHVRRRMSVRFARRGNYVFGPAVAASGDYLGLLQRTKPVPGTHSVLVLPKIFRLVVGSLPSNALQGRDQMRRLLFTDPLLVIGARAYLDGDAYRMIDWRATARLGSLMVRLNEPSTTPILDIVLDLGSMAAALQNPESDELDFMISVAASIAAHATEKRWEVGLRGNGHSNRRLLFVGSSSAASHLGEILETLAQTSPFPSEAIDSYLLRSAGRFAGPGVSIVVITRLLSASLLAAANTLRRRGRAVTIVYACPAEAPMPEPRTLAIWRVTYEREWIDREALVIGQ